MKDHTRSTPASPRAKRAMRSLGVDAAAIHGSGPGGRIVEADVLKARGQGSVASGRQVPLTAMRQAVARRTAESFATIPHFYLRAEADVTELAQLRSRVMEGVLKETGARLSLTDFLLCAMGRALADCPWANRIWQKDGLVALPGADVGLVVALEDGLLAPVIRGADRLTPADAAKERSRLATGARSGKLPADALGGAATSLSNLGDTRVDEFAAIIMPRQSSMLAVGRAGQRPYVHGGQLCVRTTMRLCLSVDHRVMDGLAGAKFLNKIVERLEKPEQL